MVTSRRRETEIVREILRLLHALKIPAWRMNSRVVTLPGKGGRPAPYRMGGVKGMADILGLLPPSGRLLAIEVKRPGKGDTVTLEQRTFQHVVTNAGGLAIVATSAAEVLRALGRPTP